MMSVRIMAVLQWNIYALFGLGKTVRSATSACLFLSLPTGFSIEVSSSK